MGMKLMLLNVGNVRGFLVVLLCLALIALPCVYLPNAVMPQKFPSLKLPSSFNFDGRGTQLTEKEHAQLKLILSKSSMVNKTVIITTLNQAWATTPFSMIDLFLQSFKLGDGTNNFLDHLIIVALDQKAYDRCKSIHDHCFFLKTEGIDFSGEKKFMTDDYVKMMWRRIDFLGTVLEMGYNFIFTDADIMWFRNPFLYFDQEADFQIACDHFNGNPFDLRNEANGGFNYVKSNNKTIKFYRLWYFAREFYPGKHDQDVLNYIKHEDVTSRLGLKFQFLDTAHFGGFCEFNKDFNNICTLHANCCYGLKNKLEDLKLILEDWKHFRISSPQKRLLESSNWRVPRNCKKRSRFFHLG